MNVSEVITIKIQVTEKKITILATKCVPLSATITRHHCCYKVTLSTGQPVTAVHNCKSLYVEANTNFFPARCLTQPKVNKDKTDAHSVCYSAVLKVSSTVSLLLNLFIFNT